MARNEINESIELLLFPSSPTFLFEPKKIQIIPIGRMVYIHASDPFLSLDHRRNS